MVETLHLHAQEAIDALAVVSFLGASPRTARLPSSVETDGEGFVLTRRDLAGGCDGTRACGPFALETSHPGVDRRVITPAFDGLMRPSRQLATLSHRAALLREHPRER